MPNKYTESLFELADVVASDAADTGEIRVNLGDASLGTGIDAGLPLWFVDGLASRPADPDANGAAQALFFADGNARRVVATRDRRHLSSAGTLDPGDRVLYAPGGARVVVDDSAGAVEIRTPGGAVMRLTDDAFTVSLPGGATLTLSDAEFDVSIPTTPLASGFTIDASGVVASAPNLSQTIHLDAGSFVTLGLTAGTTRPSIPSVENVNIGPGGGITVPSPKVFAASA